MALCNSCHLELPHSNLSPTYSTHTHIRTHTLIPVQGQRNMIKDYLSPLLTHNGLVAPGRGRAALSLTDTFSKLFHPPHQEPPCLPDSCLVALINTTSGAQTWVRITSWWPTGSVSCCDTHVHSHPPTWSSLPTVPLHHPSQYFNAWVSRCCSYWTANLVLLGEGTRKHVFSVDTWPWFSPIRKGFCWG